MKTIHEASNKDRASHITLCKYRYLNNVSHFHSDHELIYVHDGRATVTVNGEVFHLCGGGCVFVHSNDIHYIQSDADTFISVVKADGKFFDHLFAGKRLCSPLLAGRYGMERIFDEMRRETQTDDFFSDTAVDCIATSFFISMIRQERLSEGEENGARRSDANKLYVRISEKILRDYDTVTFDDAAEYMHFSRPYFSKIFRGIFGMSFTQYLNTVRIAFAVEKLRSGTMSITEISASCGFNTIRNFNRVFKSMTGYSPNRLPADYVFIYNLDGASRLDPTLNCTEVLY